MTAEKIRVYAEKDPFAVRRSRAVVAAGGPTNPPKDWFDNPGFKPGDGRMARQPDGSWATPLTVTADGQVFGHIAAWGTDHIGMPGQNVKPPRSASDYAYFNLKPVLTASGEEVHTGTLTLAGGHAPLRADAATAVKHYDDTASAVADIRVGEDEYGIWAAGAVRSEVGDTDLRALRASAPSGDWRPINGGLELVAVCQVNVPGFPIARARVASGVPVALVAAGAMAMMQLKYRELDTSLIERLDRLESMVASLSAPIVDAEKAKLRERVRN